MKSVLRTSFFLAAICILLPFTNVNAQINNALLRGNFTIGSGLGYVNSITNIKIESNGTVVEGGNSAYQLHLTPALGYFFTRNFVFGLGMDYLITSSKDRTENDPDAKSSSDTKLLFGPYSRIYFPFAGDQALFLGGVFGYGKSETEIDGSGDRQVVNTTLLTYGIGPGYSIFSNDRVSLEVMAKYNYGVSRNTFDVAGVSQNTRTLTTAWDFVIGMHFYFAANRGGGGSRSVSPPERMMGQ